MDRLFYTLIAIGLLLHLFWLPWHLGGNMEIRQADTAAIARNFAESGESILKPQIDWRGVGPGYVEADAQIFPYLTSLIYRLVGVHEWIGRLISLIFSSLTAWLVYLFGSRIADQRFALTATAVFFILPLETFYGSAFMSEPLMLLGQMGAVVFFERWVSGQSGQSGRSGQVNWWISLGCFCLAALIKPMSLVIGLPLAVLAYERFSWGFLYRKSLLLYALILFVVTAAYYHSAHQLFLTYGNSFWLRGYGIWLDPAQLLSGDFWIRMIGKVLLSHPLTYGGFLLFLIGISRRNGRHHRLLISWALAVIASFFIVAKGNLLHSHYQMPLMIPGSFLISGGLTWIFTEANSRKAIRYIGIIALSLLFAQIAYKQWAHIDIAKASQPRIELAKTLDRTLPPDAKLITLDDDSPLMLYYAHRKGWIEKPSPDQLVAASRMGVALYIAGGTDAVGVYLKTIPLKSEVLTLPSGLWGTVAKLSFTK